MHFCNYNAFYSRFLILEHYRKRYVARCTHNLGNSVVFIIFKYVRRYAYFTFGECIVYAVYNYGNSCAVRTVGCANLYFKHSFNFGNILICSFNYISVYIIHKLGITARRFIVKFLRRCFIQYKAVFIRILCFKNHARLSRLKL